MLTQGEATIATHEDLKDEEQTVHVEESKTPESPETPRLLPKTGDDTNVGPFVAALAVSGSALVALGVSALRRRRRDDGWDDGPDDGYPHIRRGHVMQVMPDLGKGGGDPMRKAILMALCVVALTAYACCRVAGEAGRMEGLHR